jgi:fatty-acyl-CoA synthase
MILSGGDNVYPAEVEAVLYDHPAIAELAVIGQPDERWGEAVVAIAAGKPGASLGLDELRSWATERRSRYKLRTRFETVAALPRNPAGKLLQFELPDRFVRR